MTLQSFLTASPEARVQAIAGQYFPDHQVHLDRLQGDASTRMYFRLRGDGKSFIAAVYPEGFTGVEFPFVAVTDLFARSGIAVPEVHKVLGTVGIIVLADLGDVRLQDALDSFSAPQKKAVYLKAADVIVDIQQTTDLAVAEHSIAARLAFDEEKLFWELNFFYENYFVNFLNARLDAGREALLLGEFSALARRLANAPRVVCHRDYHSRNLMYCEGRLYVIDHQDARLGPATYDLASLLGDPYACLDEALQAELKTQFWERHRAVFGDRCYRSRQDFEDEYHLMMVQRMIKALGTFTHQAAVKNNPVYLPYIPHAFEAVNRALASIADLPFTSGMVEAALCEHHLSSI